MKPSKKKKKFDGRDNNSPITTKYLVTQNIFFLPMSIVYLVVFRTLGHHFLLGKNKHKPPPPQLVHSAPSHPMSK
jgi:hypothetical protein